MEAAGMDVWFPLEKLAVRGYFEVLKHYFEIVGIRRKLRRRLFKPGRMSSSASTRRISISTSSSS